MKKKYQSFDVIKDCRFFPKKKKKKRRRKVSVNILFLFHFHLCPPHLPSLFFIRIFLELLLL